MSLVAVLRAFRRIVGAEAIESDLKDAITLARELPIRPAATRYPDVPQFKLWEIFDFRPFKDPF